jgi:hypothetical protein
MATWTRKAFESYGLTQVISAVCFIALIALGILAAVVAIGIAVAIAAG